MRQDDFEEDIEGLLQETDKKQLKNRRRLEEILEAKRLRSELDDCEENSAYSDEGQVSVSHYDDDLFTEYDKDSTEE